MKAYELLLMLSPSLEDEARAAVLEKTKGVIETGGGKADSVEPWGGGRRKLAFEIDGTAEGDYHLVEFHSDPAAIAELDRVLHITDQVVRYMIVRRDDRE